MTYQVLDGIKVLYESENKRNAEIAVRLFGHKTSDQLVIKPVAFDEYGDNAHVAPLVFDAPGPRSHYQEFVADGPATMLADGPFCCVEWRNEETGQTVTKPVQLVSDDVDKWRALLEMAELNHTRYEETIGHKDADWPTFYARYIMERL